MLTCLLFWGVGSVWGQCSEPFFSEYLEGESNDKCLELFNPSNQGIDLGANQYSIQIQYSSGGILDIPLAGIIESHKTFVLCQALASPALLAKAQQTNANNLYNGDDAVLLLKDGVVIDAIGQIGQSVGQTWANIYSPKGLENTSLRRKSLFYDGDANPNNDFSPAWEWDAYDLSDHSDLGMHSFEGCQAISPKVFFSVNKIRLSESTNAISIPITSNQLGMHQVGLQDYPLNIPNGFYQLISDTVSFAHSRTALIHIQIVGDSLAGCGKQLFLELRNARNCTIEYPEVMSLEIMEDDTPLPLPAAGIVLVGYDTWAASGGFDQYVITNLVPLPCNTRFWLANALFEHKAQGYERTNRWYNGNGNLSLDIPRVEVAYHGLAPLPAGSLITITLNGVGYVEELLLNGNPSVELSHNGGSLVQASSSSPDAIFLMQGSFSPRLRDSDHDSYRLFDGRVFGGLQTRGWWQPFTAPGNTGGSRVSRRHPDIACWEHRATGSATAHYGYHAGIRKGSLEELVRSISDPAEWESVSSSSSAGHNDLIGRLHPYTVEASNANDLQEYKWVGEGDSPSWYDCRNWNWRGRPSKEHHVKIETAQTILADGGERVEFGIPAAQCHNLNFVAGNFMLQDTLIICGNWEESNNASTDASRGVVHWGGAQSQRLQALNASFGYWQLAKQNRTAVLLQHDVTITRKLQLDSGLIDTGSHSLQLGGQLIGGNSNSYVIGALSQKLNIMEGEYVFPVGGEGHYMPVTLYPRYGAGSLFKVAYHPTPPINISQLHPALSRVNSSEYWDISTQGASLGEEVRITLPWGAHSNDTTQAMHREVAHWNALDGRWEPQGVSLWVGNSSEGETTSKWVGEFSPFAVGNTLIENPLPTLWNGFQVGYGDNGLAHELIWSLSEIAGIGQFRIERSLGLEGFELLELLPFSSTQQQFTWQDLNPPIGTSYYRVGYDVAGNTIYTPVKKLVSREKAAWAMQMTDWQLEVVPPQKQAFEVAILNFHAQVQEHVQSQGGIIYIDASQWPKGIYLVQLRQHDMIEVRKVLVH